MIFLVAFRREMKGWMQVSWRFDGGVMYLFGIL
jgi:hypothetical protein